MFERFLTECAGAYGWLLETQRAYDRPLGDRAIDIATWKLLAEDSVERAAGIRLLLDVCETDDPEPYPDAMSMCEDIAAGCFRVSTANSEHPVWTVAQNVAFRTVHDVLGHYAASIERARPGVGAGGGLQPNRSQGQFIDGDSIAGFDWEGENAACAAHGRLLPGPETRRALFTECLAQTAYAIDGDGFGPQVIGDCAPYLANVGGEVYARYMRWLCGDATGAGE